MTHADGGSAATTTDPRAVVGPPPPVNLALRWLALATMVMLGSLVGYVLALIIAAMTGILPMGLC